MSSTRRHCTTATRSTPTRLFLTCEGGGAQQAAEPAPLPLAWSRLEEEALLGYISRQVSAGVISGWPAPRAQGESFWLQASEAVSAVNGGFSRSGKYIRITLICYISSLPYALVQVRHV